MRVWVKGQTRRLLVEDECCAHPFTIVSPVTGYADGFRKHQFGLKVFNHSADSPTRPDGFDLLRVTLVHLEDEIWHTRGYFRILLSFTPVSFLLYILAFSLSGLVWMCCFSHQSVIQFISWLSNLRPAATFVNCVCTVKIPLQLRRLGTPLTVIFPRAAC
jgi:hypothetical protein